MTTTAIEATLEKKLALLQESRRFYAYQIHLTHTGGRRATRLTREQLEAKHAEYKAEIDAVYDLLIALDLR